MIDDEYGPLYQPPKRRDAPKLPTKEQYELRSARKELRRLRRLVVVLFAVELAALAYVLLGGHL